MKRFVSRNKLSKRAKRMLDAKGRSFWLIHPATKCPPKSTAYDRKKARNETRKEIDSALSSSHMQLWAQTLKQARIIRGGNCMSIYKPGRPSKYVPATDAGIKPPKKPGEYRIRDTVGTIQYVGETCNLNRRMHEHVRTGKLAEGWSIECKVADGRSTSATQRQHEQAKIEQHQPPLNKSKGGEGRPAGR